MEEIIRQALSQKWPWRISVRDSHESAETHPLTLIILSNRYAATFGSNFIESLGSSRAHTEAICETVFKQEQIDATDTYTDDFYGVAEYLGRFPSEHEVVRTRHEIIRRAKAYI
jgi:hypothetical protein